MRRTLNECETIFQKKNIIQTTIVPKIVESLGSVYPELETQSKNICDIFTFEDESHKSLIENNRKNFKSLNISTTSNLKEDDVIEFSQFPLAYRDVERLTELNRFMKSLPIEFVFNKLHLAYGLNEDLIQKLAAEKKLNVNMEEFEAYKKTKQEETKSQHQIEESSVIAKASAANLPPTVYRHMYDYAFDKKSRQFLVKPLKAKVFIVDYNAKDDFYHIVLDKTNFYHTAGGQDSDIGQIVGDDGAFEVKNVTIHNGFVVHTGRFVNEAKPFQSNEEVTLTVNPSHRTNLSQHHTAMHLLQAAMKKVTNRIVFQQSSHVSAANLKCEFGVIGKRIRLEQLEQIERLIQKVIQSAIPIDVQFLSAHDLYALNNLTTVPGATYPENDIRILRIKDEVNEFESIEPCCGTHAKNTSELEDFCFTYIKVNNSASYDITAVAGRLAESIKQNGKHFLQTYEMFKNKVYLDNDEDGCVALETEASQIKRQLADSPIPYITSSTITSEMETLDKHILAAKRKLIRQALISEMLSVLTARKQKDDPFVIHVIRTKAPLEKMILAEAEQMCNDLPVILINVSNNQIIQGRASIPLKYTDKKFDAKDWLNEVVRPFHIKCSKSKTKANFNQSSFEEFPDQSTALVDPSDLEKILRRAEDIAYKMFAKKYSADEDCRVVQSFQLKKNIQDIHSKVNAAKTLTELLGITSFVMNLRNEIKYGLYPYELKSTCFDEIQEINYRLTDARFKIESELHNPALEKTLATASLNKRTYAFHVIHASHPLHTRTILRMTDECADIALVLIIVSNYDVIGRIAIPISKTDAKSIIKELRDEFCGTFNGKCIHEGSRLEAYVADFQFDKTRINDDSLKNAFKRAENLLISKK
ncbi:Alanine--tRNA ligase, mitochondrial [Pseudolycoriella hygida]|uniref:alanine--tRNA ligase n=1 Tax=Pseudolycoriella hygida TaxID=35572 RepID=A0A9Q0MN40_9DIPT|nr:Alanine--tRNA ligase, mitochondrial [Pseudolycoriella hygida]